MSGKILFFSCALALTMVVAGSASAQVPIGNNYVCHKVKDLKVPAKFVGSVATAVDQVANHNLDLKKPFLLCNPAIVNASPIIDPTLHYVCYKAKGGKFAISFDTTDMFGPLRLQTKKPFLLCSPASKVPA